jgi:hypothetical protein
MKLINIVYICHKKGHINTSSFYMFCKNNKIFKCETSIVFITIIQITFLYFLLHKI